MEKDKEQSVEMRTHSRMREHHLTFWKCLMSKKSLWSVNSRYGGAVYVENKYDELYQDHSAKEQKRSGKDKRADLRHNSPSGPTGKHSQMNQKQPNKGQSCVSTVEGWRGWSGSHLTALMTALRGAERSSRVTSQWQPRSSRESSVLMPASTERGR